MDGATGESGGAMRSAYVWNTLGSALNAFQSVFMLMAITRVCGLSGAGVFTLAYANANLFLTLGTFGMRNFEASDVGRRYGFSAYARSRALTCAAMVACSWAWLAWASANNGYPREKTLAVALMTLVKAVDAVEDVYDGAYQREGRLDVAGRLMSVRTASTVLVFCFAVAATRSLVAATAASLAWTSAFLAIGVSAVRRRCGLPPADAPMRGSVRSLLSACLPLFLSAFLLYYVGNAPKYAIDAAMGDAEQAVYGFIAMPVFVVGLLAQFVYAPLVRPLSASWAAGRRREFRRAVGVQVLVILGITLACVLAAALAGPPVLGWLYACDLADYRPELCALVAGGGLLALASLFTMGVTVMREQERLVPAYAAVSVAAALASGPLVGALGIAGAACCYVASMAALAAWFAALFTHLSQDS